MDPDKILIVDDEPDFVTALAKRMRAHGYVVETASRGQEAIDKVSTKDFTAILLDLKMPGFDGLETLKELRKIDPDLQIILLTGHGSIREGVEAMKQGALDFLEKPADFDALMGKIGKAKAKRMLLVSKNAEKKMTDILKRKAW